MGRSLCGEPREVAPHEEPDRNREQDHLGGAHEQAQAVHVDSATDDPGGEQGRASGSQHRRERGHRHRERDVGLGQVSDHVGSRAAGTAADQHQAHGKRRRQLKQIAHAPSEKRHHRVLQEHPPEDGRGSSKNAGEVGELEREPHAEHDDLEARRDESVVEEPGERRRVDERDDTAEGDPEGKEPDERGHEVAM